MASLTFLTKQDMDRGIILLPCAHCKETTKHQTVNEKGKPLRRGHLTHVQWNGFRTPRKLRKCLHCGTIVTF